MRILVIYYKPFFPINSGDKNVIVSHIQVLSRFADIDLLSFGLSEEIKGNLPGLRRHIYIKHSKLERLIALLNFFSWKKPLQCALYSIPSVKRWLKHHADDYDILYPHFFRSFALVENLHTRIILHLHDALSLNYSRAIETNLSFWRQLIYRYEMPRLKHYEIACIHKAEHTFTVSSCDREYFIAYGADEKKITHIPITVSEHLFTISKPIKPKQICFFGNMSYIANIDAVEWFVKNVFPHLPNDITFIIIGSSPPEQIKKLASNRITVTGFVKNPYELIAESAIMIAPLRIASGVQVKILEGMALGKTIITSSKCAQAFGVNAQEIMLIADLPNEYFEGISTLLNDTSMRQEIGKKARSYCIIHHSKLNLFDFFSE